MNNNHRLNIILEAMEGVRGLSFRIAHHDQGLSDQNERVERLIHEARVVLDLKTASDTTATAVDAKLDALKGLR